MSLPRSITALAPLLLIFLVGCGNAESKPDYDTPPDPAKYRKHVEDALERKDVSDKFDQEKGVKIYRTKDKTALFTGWCKSTRGDGAARLTRIVDGLEQGASITWYGDASPMDSGWMLDGKRHGAYTFWNREGKASHRIYNAGVIIDK